SLKTKLGKVVKGADRAFVEGVIRELIAADALLQHPEKRKGTPLFGASPPPPPLEQPKHLKAVNKIAGECQKLVAAAGASFDDLFRLLRSRLSDAEAAPAAAGSHVPTGALSLDEPEGTASADA